MGLGHVIAQESPGISHASILTPDVEIGGCGRCADARSRWDSGCDARVRGDASGGSSGQHRWHLVADMGIRFA